MKDFDKNDATINAPSYNDFANYYNNRRADMVARVSYQTIHNNSINYMLTLVEEYELVKSRKHHVFKHARAFFEAKNVCFQNFYKFYNRFLASDRDPDQLLPMKRGPKPKFLSDPLIDNGLEQKVLHLRQQGYNKFVISAVLQKDKTIKGAKSPSSVYRLFTKLGLQRKSLTIKREEKRITREHAGSLIHIDCHYLPKGVIKSSRLKKLYVLGAIDTYSRICWIEVVESVKSLDVSFAMLDVLLIMSNRYGIEPEEALTDNGSEFCGSERTKAYHPFERLLDYFGIKHRRTKPYRPQTNGKIERLWKTFDEDVIEGCEFETLDSLKEAVMGFNLYYNEHRPHQGISGKTPITMLK